MDERIQENGNKKRRRKLRVLELGAGTGLVGLAAAAAWNADVHLTDIASIVPNLERNVVANEDLIRQYASKSQDKQQQDQDDEQRLEITTGVLNWEELSTTESSTGPNLARMEGCRDGNDKPKIAEYDAILTADTLYDESLPRLLVDTIRHFSESSGNSHILNKKDGSQSRRPMVVMIEIPLREGYQREKSEFEQRMFQAGFRLEDQGVEVGWDDWGDGSGIPPRYFDREAQGQQHVDEVEEVDGRGGSGRVKCWWAVWIQALGESGTSRAAQG